MFSSIPRPFLLQLISISFIIVLLGVILLVRWIANLIQAAIKIAMLGWLNKLGGVILYLFIYLFVY